MYAVTLPGLMPNHVFIGGRVFFVFKPKGRILLLLPHLPLGGLYISEVYSLVLLF